MGMRRDRAPMRLPTDIMIRLHRGEITPQHAFALASGGPPVQFRQQPPAAGSPPPADCRSVRARYEAARPDIEANGPDILRDLLRATDALLERQARHWSPCQQAARMRSVLDQHAAARGAAGAHQPESDQAGSAPRPLPDQPIPPYRARPDGPAPEFVDLVVPLGTGSRHDDLELRILLRSAAENLRGLRTVHVIGPRRPAWLQDAPGLIWHPWTPITPKNHDIIAKFLYAAGHPDVAETFVASCDDWAFLLPVRPGVDWGAVRRHGVLSTETGAGYWKRAQAETRQVLDAAGFPSEFFDYHAPTVQTKAGWRLVEERVAWRSVKGHAVWSLYHNVAGRHGPDIGRDNLSHCGWHAGDGSACPHSDAEIESASAHRRFINYNDGGWRNGILPTWLLRRFGEASPWERRDLPIVIRTAAKPAPARPTVPVRTPQPAPEATPNVAPATPKVAASQTCGMCIVTCAWGNGQAQIDARRRAMATWGEQTIQPHIVLVELVEPGAASRYADLLPHGRSTHIVRPLDPRSQRGLMHKEHLMNIGAAAVPAECTILVFLDGDVRSETPHWFAEIAAAFAVAPPGEPILVQGFRHMRDTVDRKRHYYSVGSREAIPPKPKEYRQPGLCWCMHRNFWQEIGGLNPFCISGSGDVMLLDELCSGVYQNGHERSCTWWRGVRRKGLPRPRLTFAHVDVVHEHHGPFKERAYWPSRQVIDWVETPVHEMVELCPSGLRWINPDCRLADVLADKPAIANLGVDAASRRAGLIRPYHQTVFGWFNFEDCYRQFVREAPHGATLVEIGSYLGKSLTFLAVHAHNANKGLHVHAFDPCPGGMPARASRGANKAHGAQTGSLYDGLLGNISACGAPVLFRRGDANQFVDEYLDGSLFGVWLDADHLYHSTIKFLDLWWPKVQPGGLFGGHDYLNETWPGVKQAVDEWTAARGIPIEVRGALPCGSFLLRKPKG